MTRRQDDAQSCWQRVGVGCFQRRYRPLDVSIGVVCGARGLFVVDSLASPTEARRLRADIARRWSSPVRHLLNTHGHFDHCFGNEVFSDAAVWGHRSLPDYARRWASATRQDAVAHGYQPADLPAAVRPPDQLVTSSATVDLGDLTVDLRHLGRGHTEGDLVAHVPAAGVVFCGDLVEQSGPPALGVDSYPLDWPDTLTRLLALAGPDGVFVPGHGAAVDARFVRAQRDALALVANTVRRAFQAGLPAPEAEWLLRATVRDPASPGASRPRDTPGPPRELAVAVARGYAQLSAADQDLTGNQTDAD